METEQPADVQETASEPAKMETNGASEAQAGDKTAQPSPPKQVLSSCIIMMDRWFYDWFYLFIKQVVKAVELQVENKTSSISLQSLQDLTEREVIDV